MVGRAAHGGSAWREVASLTAQLAAGAMTFLASRLLDVLYRLGVVAVEPHREVLRSGIPRPLLGPIAVVGAWAPLAISVLARTHPGLPLGSGLAVALLAEVVLLEVSIAWMQGQCWEAARQPDTLRWRTPLGGEPMRPSDRRLQVILASHLAVAVPLFLGAAVTPLDRPLMAMPCLWAILSYFAYAKNDFEACVHWDMHCHVLRTRDRRWCSKALTLMSDLLVGPMNGYIPWMYRSEHIRAHHWANAGPKDPFSPIPYRRTSFLECSVFTIRVVAGSITGSTWLGHPRLGLQDRVQMTAGLLVFWGAVIALSRWGSVLGPALVLFAVLQAVSVAQDQLVWHGLIDPEAPMKVRSSTIQWIGETIREPPEPGPMSPAFNEIDWAFLDNFHLTHHLHPSRHYTEYPDLIERDAAEIRDARAIVLPLSYMGMFLGDLWREDLDRMAGRMVSALTVEQRCDLLRERVAAVPATGRAFPLLSTPSRAALVIDHVANRVAVAFL